MKRHAADRETRRIEALESYNVLDTPREKDFDDIAALAAQICQTPIGVVNLIARDRQFFKAEVGLGVRETPLASSFCAKAILEQDFLLVPDATLDERFNCNPLVVGEPFIRFYAGALLKSDNGYPIGTLCVLGHEPKMLTSEQQFALNVLANQAIAQLELRKRIQDLSYDLSVERRLSSKRKARVASIDAKNEQLKENEVRNATAQAAGGIGIFEVDTRTNTINVSDEFCRIFGVGTNQTYEATFFENLVLDEDRDQASSVQSRNDATAHLAVEYRIRRPLDQRIRWIARRAQFLPDDEGKSSKMVGVAIDITDAKRKDARVAALLALGDRLSVADTMQDICQIASEVLHEGLGVDRSGYATISQSEQSFKIEYEHFLPMKRSLAGTHSMADFARTIARLSEGKLISVSDVSTEPFLNGEAANYIDSGIRSFIKAPLLKNGALVGVLFTHEKKPRFWSKAELDFVAGVTDRTYAAVAKLNAEAEQRVLNTELSHRLKNTLSIVHALIGQTLRNVSERDAVNALTGRIQALGSAHELLLQQSWSSAQLHQVIEQAMKLHSDGDRIFLHGPTTELGPKAGLSIALLLHELGTNALKYGALSNESGQVHISWMIIDKDKEQPELQLRWEEKFGPIVSEPQNRGFGSRLINMGLNGTGNVELLFKPTGLIATFCAPFAMIGRHDD